MRDSKEIREKNRVFFHKKQLEFFNISPNPIREYFNKRLTSNFTKFLRFLPPNCLEDKIILDAGCNDGYFHDFYYKKGTKMAVGCDISHTAMLRGRMRNYGILRDKDTPYSTMLFTEVDLEDMPFKENTFDTILCFGTWHHLLKRERFVRQCRSLLRQNGFFIVSDPNKSSPFRKTAHWVGIFLNELIAEEFHTTASEARDILEENNFEVKEVIHYNTLSEPLGHFCDILSKRNSIFYWFFIFVFLILNAIDYILDRTIIKLLPAIGWSYMIVCRKKEY